MFLLTSELNPSIIIIRKNSIAQSGDTGIWAIASGYAINARPGPKMWKQRDSIDANVHSCV